MPHVPVIPGSKFKGGAGGTLTPGRFVKWGGKPMSNLLLNMGVVGVHAAAIPPAH